jgi:hypothetical protein
MTVVTAIVTDPCGKPCSAYIDRVGSNNKNIVAIAVSRVEEDLCAAALCNPAYTAPAATRSRTVQQVSFVSPNCICVKCHSVCQPEC